MGNNSIKSMFSLNSNNNMEENQFTKENHSNDSPIMEIKFDKTNTVLVPNIDPNSDEVLTSVTNSLKNPNPNSNHIEYKKSNSENVDSSSNFTLGFATSSNSNPNNPNSLSAKKENDKKIWRKRI